MPSPNLHWIECATRELAGLSRRRAAAREWALSLVPIVTPLFEGDYGQTLEATAEILNGNDVPARRGGTWSKTQVMRLINIGGEHSLMPRKMDEIRLRISEYERHRFDTVVKSRGKTVDLAQLVKDAAAQIDHDAQQGKLVEVEIQAALRWRFGTQIVPLERYQTKDEEAAIKAEWFANHRYLDAFLKRR
jgi:hypothetical protein